MDNLSNEQEFLKSIYQTYDDRSPYERFMREYIIKLIKPFLNKKMTGLEFGCSDGFMSKKILDELIYLDIVDGAQSALNDAKKQIGDNQNVKYYCSLFETFSTEKKYDVIFASYILEHVLNPDEILDKIKSLLNPNGIAIIVVPNSRALSRQISLNMGFINDLKDLTPNDLKHGHRRVYDRKSLNITLKQNNFVNLYEGGVILKLLADFQMDKIIEDKVIDYRQINALFELGLEYPDLCGSLLTIITPVR